MARRTPASACVDPRQLDLTIEPSPSMTPFGTSNGIIYAMDCLLGLECMPSRSVDFVFADLPYGMTMHDWDKFIPIASLWNRLHRVCKLDTPMVFTCVQPFTSLLIASNFDEFRHEMIWQKNKSSSFLNAKRSPLRIHEDVLVFCRDQMDYNFEAVKTDGHAPMNAAKRKPTSKSYGKHGSTKNDAGTTRRYATSVLNIPVVNNDDPDRIHPMQKPVALVEWFLRAYTKPDDLVLDPAAGSGTTLVAAKRLGRRSIGFESDVAMAGKANERIRHVP